MLQSWLNWQKTIFGISNISNIVFITCNKFLENESWFANMKAAPYGLEWFDSKTYDSW